ncbi:MAG: pyruvate carboxylase [Armatimonadetes bacterium]|nr:pyruvate carboxylase [Armatimonadota bacterium]
MESIREFERIMVANRGEIAIRVFRACTELGKRTIGIYSKEDKLSLHRYKADETYLVGENADPVKAYLDIPGILSIALRHRVDAIHPGYGFLSENPAFARACQEVGVTFIGPTPDLLELMGDKVAARKQAESAGIPIVPGTEEPVRTLEAALGAAEKIGYPVIFKASFGGGGRGMRVARTPEEVAQVFEQATREASAAFGIGDIFIEKYLDSPKHIEVQIIGDRYGNTTHLFERDCSIQRRHQKVVEIAPCPTLDEERRKELCEAALALTRSVGYINAGTVEFLLDQEGRFYFIEMNPRIQVEHTVTEMITGVDIVKTQIRIAEGHSLNSPQIGLGHPETMHRHGFAIQCRITTEDPANNFVPDYGRLAHYRSAAGFGIRLDAGTAFSGAVITPFYDSLLVKISAHSLTLEDSARKMARALSEFRVRGLRTNIPFLEKVVIHPAFLAGRCDTGFIEKTPELFDFIPREDRATKLLQFISEISINGNPDVPKDFPVPKLRQPVVPPYDPDSPIPEGTRDIFKKLGPEKFSEWVLAQKSLLLTDTTLRDAHQSLLATRVRTFDMLNIAHSKARNLQGFFSLEMWGGATFDTSMRFLKECPWERLAVLREAMPNILFQMLLRGANAVGYTNYPDNVVRYFIREAAVAGIDIFRIFDSLNWIPGMEKAIQYVREAGAIAEAAICYTGDIFDPARQKYSLDYYLKLAKDLKALGTNMLAIKDMAGLCRPYAARALVKALKEETGLPIHFHTHDTAGVQAASILMAAEAGADITDVALSAMSGLTSQVNLNSIVAALQRQERDTGIDIDTLDTFSYYWEAVREYYSPFESGMKASTADVYVHEIPGGQYSNLRPQAESLGLGDRLPELKRMYATVNEMFGDIVKVTPSSKVVGDMALYMMTNNLTPEDIYERGYDLSFPASVIGFFAGEIGQVPGGLPEKLRRVILKDRPPVEGRPGDHLPPVSLEKVREDLEGKLQRSATDQEIASYLMYPDVFLKFAEHRQNYSDVSIVPTSVFFYGMAPGEETTIEIEKGKTLFIKLIAIGEPNEQGVRTLFYELNGHPRSVEVFDKSLGIEVKTNLKADPDNFHHVGAPMPGMVVAVPINLGDTVQKGDKLVVIEAMKMETTMNSPRDGVVKDILVSRGVRVDTGDLLVVFA